MFLFPLDYSGFQSGLNMIDTMSFKFSLDLTFNTRLRSLNLHFKVLLAFKN